MRLVEDSRLIAIGHGGPREPFRYFIHPLIIGALATTNQREAKRLEKALNKDPGANRAAAIWQIEMMRGK
jgi:hypothetical protein